MRKKLIFAALILVTHGILFTGGTIQSEMCETNRQLQQCKNLTNRVLQPLLDSTPKVKDELGIFKQKRAITEYKANRRYNKGIIKELRGQIIDLKKNIKFQKKTIQRLTQTHEILKLININKTSNDLEVSKTDIDRLETVIISHSCISDIHPICVSDYGYFDVLYDNKTAGPGWIVIQQRIDGRENFERDWNTYAAGFGSFRGDFFLGLEKIHQLTSSMRYELYIHMEKYDGTTKFAHYDHFIIEGRDQDYKLSSLGNYLENDGKGDYFQYHKGMKFYTYDRDRSDGCAKDFRGGWWFFGCAGCFLNGVYSETDHGNKSSRNFWAEYGNLKTTQMLIRPYQE